jgi:hypothetical protein
LLVLAVLAGCAASPAAAPPPVSAASPACPEHVAEAEAWINRMPGTGTSARQLVVSARLADGSATALLLRSNASTTQELVLDIRAAGAAPVPGRLGYREPAPERPYSSILLRCRGGDDYTIDEIAAVY